MNKRRVVITGLGVVAPNGIGKDAFWKNLVAGKSGIREITSADFQDLPCRVAGEVTEFTLSAFSLSRKSRAATKYMSRVSQFAVACARMALTDSALDLTKVDPSRVGVCYGTTIGKPDLDQEHLKLINQGVSALDPAAWAELPPHAATSHVAQELGVVGPTFTCSAGCSTGLMAVEWGVHQIISGAADAVIVGSADSLLSRLMIAGLYAGDLLTKQKDPTTACRPYDVHRDGLVPSEAGGAVVLESLELATERNAHLYGEYVGFASGHDLRRIRDVNSDGKTLAEVITAALRNAGLSPDRIDCINSHGLSHPLFDITEIHGFKLALAQAAYQIPITSIKSTTGASFSADGMLQIISSCLMLENSLVPPTINLTSPDPLCDLDFVRDRPRVVRLKRLLTNTRAVGGTHTVLLLGRPDA